MALHVSGSQQTMVAIQDHFIVITTVKYSLLVNYHIT
jgi:hypothetical protein